MTKDALTVTTKDLKGDTIDDFTIVSPKRVLTVSAVNEGYTVTYTPSETESGTAVFAFYDADGRMLRTALKSTDGTQITFTVPLAESVSRVSVFSFDGTDTLHPLAGTLDAIPQ